MAKLLDFFAIFALSEEAFGGKRARTGAKTGDSGQKSSGKGGKWRLGEGKNSENS